MMTVIGILAIVGTTVYLASWFGRCRKRWAQEDAEDKAFEEYRMQRQAEFDRDAHEVARWALMMEASQIHFAGEVYHE